MNQFKLMIPQATAQGYVTCPPRSVFDLNYPDSKFRRGRVQGGGKICPALTATMGELLVFEDVYEEECFIPEPSPAEHQQDNTCRLRTVRHSDIDP